jgi:hypothetical protein
MFITQIRNLHKEHSTMKQDVGALIEELNDIVNYKSLAFDSINHAQQIVYKQIIIPRLKKVLEGEN